MWRRWWLKTVRHIQEATWSNNLISQEEATTSFAVWTSRMKLNRARKTKNRGQHWLNNGDAMQVFLLSGKAIGGFNGYATLASLEVLVWNIFQIEIFRGTIQ